MELETVSPVVLSVKNCCQCWVTCTQMANAISCGRLAPPEDRSQSQTEADAIAVAKDGAGAECSGQLEYWTDRQPHIRSICGQTASYLL